jgi:hypothetical protein
MRRTACLDQPETCDLSTYARGSYLINDKRFVDQMIAREARVRANPNDPSYEIVDNVVVAADGLSATARVCSWDTGVIFGPGGSIFNDEKATQESNLTLILDGDQWFVSEIDEIRTVRDQNLCGPRP